MNARNDVKRPSDQSLDLRPVLAAAQLRFAARVDLFVARWLARCATNAEGAQRLFKTDRKPAHEFGAGREPGPGAPGRSVSTLGWAPMTGADGEVG